MDTVTDDQIVEVLGSVMRWWTAGMVAHALKADDRWAIRDRLNALTDDGRAIRMQPTPYHTVWGIDLRSKS